MNQIHPQVLLQTPGLMQFPLHSNLGSSHAYKWLNIKTTFSFHLSMTIILELLGKFSCSTTHSLSQKSSRQRFLLEERVGLEALQSLLFYQSVVRQQESNSGHIYAIRAVFVHFPGIMQHAKRSRFDPSTSKLGQKMYSKL